MLVVSGKGPQPLLPLFLSRPMLVSFTSLISILSAEQLMQVFDQLSLVNQIKALAATVDVNPKISMCFSANDVDALRELM